VAARAMIAVLDVEWTSWEGARQRLWQGPGEEMEMVQIGAITLTDDAALAEIAALDVLVKPRINPTLSDYFVTLTGITQQRLDSNGMDFRTALERLVRFLSTGVRAVWSYGTDYRVIQRNCAINGLAFPFDEGLFRDARVLIEDATGIDGSRVYSSALPEAMGFERRGAAHQGVDDCRCIAEALRILRRRGIF
jgi:inhibitor of KinA sporulation pathway (predicted exonuclease)